MVPRQRVTRFSFDAGCRCQTGLWFLTVTPFGTDGVWVVYNSKAPMSQLPSVRAAPRWSVAGQTVLSPASMAG